MKPSVTPSNFHTQQKGGVPTLTPVVPSVDPSGDTISLPSYVPSVNPYKAPSEQQVRALQ